MYYVVNLYAEFQCEYVDTRKQSSNSVIIQKSVYIRLTKTEFD